MFDNLEPVLLEQTRPGGAKHKIWPKVGFGITLLLARRQRIRIRIRISLGVFKNAFIANFEKSFPGT